MTTIYEFLATTKGKAYSQDQIENHPESLLSANKYPTIPFGKKVKGNSRIHGDVDHETQKIIIDMIITIGSRYHLNYKEIAYALLICRVESGFNPDAAAGTSSAAGLSQLTVDTVSAIPKRSKKYMGVELDMSGGKVFDAILGSNAIVLAFIFNRALAVKWGFQSNDPKYWQLIYMLHHDGPGDYNNPAGQERAQAFKWRKAAVDAYKHKLLPMLEPLTKMLGDGKIDTSLHLTGSDEAPVSGIDYVLAAVKKTFKNAPSHVSSKKENKPEIQLVKGKTDSMGLTKPINTGIGDEIIMLLLPKNYRDLLISSNAEDIHTVRNGETLTKIAKENNVTVDELKKTNHISNVNNIKSGQKIELPSPKQLRHKPAKWVLDEIMIKLGFHGGNTSLLSYARNHTAKPKGSTSKSTKSKPNTVELQTPVGASALNQVNTVLPTQSQTNISNPVGTVAVNGEALIYTFQDLHHGYTRFYDHHGGLIIEIQTRSGVASSSQTGAAGPYAGYYTTTQGGSRTSHCGIGYGTTKIRTTDPRCRWVHGGGSGSPQPYSENQGWYVTMGCTRAQNIDVENLASKLKDFRHSNPNVRIKYTRKYERLT
jgi:LysM repeat protein